MEAIEAVADFMEESGECALPARLRAMAGDRALEPPAIRDAMIWLFGRGRPDLKDAVDEWAAGRADAGPWAARWLYRDIGVAALLGKTLVRAEVVKEGPDGEEIVFEAADGAAYRLYHSQDCCESVEVEEIVGDLADLVGSPILMAEEVTSQEHPEGFVPGYEPESYTWTFYKFATIKGYATIRWYGTSNGYYSEGVDFEMTRTAGRHGGV